MTLGDTEKCSVTGDLRPIHYLVEKYLTERRTQEQIQAEIARLQGLLK